MEIIEFIKNLTDAEFILNWGSLSLLIFIVFAECSFLVGFFLPGNSLLFVAGGVCYEHPEVLNVSIYLLIPLLSIAAMIGYYIGYWFGFKTMGPKCLTPTTRIFIFQKKAIDFTSKFYTNHGGKTLIIGRFLPLIRNFSPVIGGMIHMNYRKYMVYNVIGAFIWVGSLTSLGYVFFKNLDIKKNLDFVMIGILLFIVAMLYFINKVRSN